MAVSHALVLLAVAGCQRNLPPTPRVDAAVAVRLRETLLAASQSSGEEAAGEQQATGEGWSTLRGRFLLAGEAPSRPRLVVTRDTEVCSPGGREVLSEALLVDSATRGIANVVVFARDVRRVHESARPDDSQVVFDQRECVFLSHVLGVKVGQTLDIKNSDPIGHNTNIQTQKGAPFNQIIASGGSIAFQPTAPEAMPVSVVCNIHPWMQAYLLPRADGYFAVTATDGSFELAHLPAGESVELQVWHESAVGAGGSLAVDTAEARELGWSKRGRFQVKLEPDQPLDITVEVPPSAFRL
jgi:hypothetical protein